MVNSRRGYAGIILMSLLLLFWTGSRYLLMICGLEFLFPIILWILLKLEARNLQIAWNGRSACVAGQELLLEIRGEQKRVRAVSGVLQVHVEYHNIMFHSALREMLTIVLSGKTLVQKLPVSTGLCGELHIRCLKMELTDLFGLCRVRLGELPERMMTVYPEHVSLQMIPGRMPQGSWDGEQDTLGRKGSDASEVFSLNDYHAGDDVRSIHWKLSAKVGSLLVREYSDAFHYDTLIMVDCGLKKDGRELDQEMLSVCAALGAEASSQLADQGFPHGVAVASDHQLYDFSVSNKTEFINMLDIWMGIGMPEGCGMGLVHLRSDQKHLKFKKLIYITVGTCPDDLLKFSTEADVTAVCLQEQGEEGNMIRQGTCDIMNVPFKLLRENIHKIFF